MKNIIYGTLFLAIALSVACASGRVQSGERLLSAASRSTGSTYPDETPTEYLLGPGDVIQVTFYEAEGYMPSVKQIETATVRQDGTVFLHLIGNIKAAGLTSNQLEIQIEEKLREYIRNPMVVVEIKEYRSQKVTVFGQAKNGIYTLDHPTYISEFIASIGGVDSEADQTKIKVTRKDGSVVMVNLKRYYEDGDLNQNILLRGGDQIFIPMQRTPRAWRYFKEWQGLTSSILALISLYLTIWGR